MDMVAKQVWYYLSNDQVRGVVQGRLKSSLEQAMQDYDDIVLVSHSLGTLVALLVYFARDWVRILSAGVISNACAKTTSFHAAVTCARCAAR